MDNLAYYHLLYTVAASDSQILYVTKRQEYTLLKAPSPSYTEQH